LAQEVTQERIDEFKQDRKLLPYDDNVIAAEINVSAANFSSYMNDRRPITNKFLKKFYQKYGEMIKMHKERHGQMLREEDLEYVKLTLQNDIIELKQQYASLTNNYNGLTQHYKAQELAILHQEEKLEVLNQKLDKLDQLEQKLIKMESQLSLLTTRLLNRKRVPLPKKDTKNPGKKKTDQNKHKKSPGVSRAPSR